jgi:Arc/MetJ family transcription regulator
MQITLNLDNALLSEAFQLINLVNQEELVNLALQELVRSRSGSSGASRRKKNLLDLAGQVQFAPDFNYKSLRETRHAAD